MIPRRKLTVEGRDFVQWMKSAMRVKKDYSNDVARFEEEFTSYLGIKHAFATSSGRDAITIGLEGMGMKSGDEILVPAYTLGELIPLLLQKGYRVVPVDIDPDTFTISTDDLRKKISERTSVVMVTHILGAPCNMPEIMKIAEEHSAYILEDCAHSLGASINGKKTGCFGKAAIFSMEANKPLPAYGGGILVTDDDKVAAFARKELAGREHTEAPALKKAFSTWIEESVIRSPFYGIINRILFSNLVAGTFEKLYRGSHDKLRKKKPAYSGFQSRIANHRLKVLDRRNQRLNEIWDRMANMLDNSYGLQKRDRFGQPAFYNFVLRTNGDTSAVRKKLRSAGIDVGVGTEVMDDCSKMLGYDDCKVTEEVFSQGLLIPLYDGLSDRKCRKIARVLNKIAVGK